jgi:NarL family two-component system response regulator LiaR
MSDENTIRVMIVDDHALVRSGLEAFLLVHKDLKLVAGAKNGQQAIAYCEQAQPDVVLMDLMMPGMDVSHPHHQTAVPTGPGHCAYQLQNRSW